MEGFSRGAMHSGTFQKDCSGCSKQKGLQGQKEKPGRGAQRGGCCRCEARNNGGLDWEAEGTAGKGNFAGTSWVVQWLRLSSQCRGPGFDPWSGN